MIGWGDKLPYPASSLIIDAITLAGIVFVLLILYLTAVAIGEGC